MILRTQAPDRDFSTNTVTSTGAADCSHLVLRSHGEQMRNV